MASRNKCFADDGWAIWVGGDDTSTIYFNEWVNPKGKSFVDVGIRIIGVQQTHELNVYVPFLLAADEIQDISHLLRKPEIFRAVLNASGLMDYKKNACTSEMAYRGRSSDLVHLSEIEFVCETLAEGTLIRVSIDALKGWLENDEAYFLFRLPNKSLDRIFDPRRDAKNLLLRFRDLLTSPVVSEKYGYSLRINEGRMLPNEINKIGAFHRQKLKKAVVTISVAEDYQVNDSNCYRIRRLEEDLYRDYAPDGFDCSDAITYHWRQTRETDLRGHFNFYFDISRDSISQISMLLYMVLLLLVGISGNILYDLIKKLLGW